LSQKIAIHQRPRAGTDKGELRAAAATQPLAKRKKTARGVRRSHFSFCIYAAILQSMGGNVNGKVASGRVPRWTRCSANNQFGRRNEDKRERMLVRATQDSLIKRINSLMSRFNSLLGRNKFPVPMRRELHGKPLNCLSDFGPTAAPKGPHEENSLYFPS
jgi:hypothetical protein